MAGLNKVMLIGNLGRDPEIRYTQGGMAVVNFSIATSEQWNDKSTGERQEKTEWHRIKVFGKQAEICEKYLSKGSSIYVEGRLQTSSWEKDGQTHYTTEIIASNFQFLGGRGSEQGGGYGNQGGGYQGHGGQGSGYGSGRGPGQGPGPNSNNYQGHASPGMTGGPDPIPDDDIPF